MARRRESVEVELVPDEGQQDGPQREVPAGVPGGVRRRWAALTRRTRILVAAAVAVVVAVPLGTAAMVDAAADRERAATLPGMPGGVADLSVAPEPGWEIATDEGVLRTLPDGGVLTRAGRDVLAVDTATGGERWRHTLGMLAECGPADGGDPADPVVCLAGPPDRRTVTVLDPDGTVVGSRDLGAVESSATQGSGVASVDGYTDRESRRSLPSVRPAADGALAVMEPGRGLVQVADADEARRVLDALRPADLPTLRVVDAVSGEVRGSATPRLATPADLAGCEEPTGGWLVDLGQPHVGVSGHLASLSVCGTLSVLTTGGEKVDGVPSSLTRMTWPLDGGLVVTTESGATVVRQDASVDLPGAPLPVRADADPSDTVVVVAADGSVLGTAPDGTRRWTAPVELGSSSSQFARADGAVVVADARGDLVALDLATGAERWRRDGVLPGPDETDRRVVGALTDGEHVVLGIRRADGYDLVALDVGSGRTTWEQGHDDRLPLAGLVAFDGHPVAVLQDREPSVRSGGDNEEGVASSDTVLRGLTTG